MTRSKPPKVSDAEMELLSLLWDDSPQSATALAEAVAARRGWSLTTVKTMLSRMAAKQIVAARQEGRRHLYSPLVERDAFASGHALNLFDRLFGGRVSPLVARLAEQRDLDPADLAELEALLKALRK